MNNDNLKTNGHPGNLPNRLLLNKTDVEPEEYTCEHNKKIGETGKCEDCEWLYSLQCSGME